MRKITYRLEDGMPVEEPDVLAWGKWFETSHEERVVAQDRVGDVLISTVFTAVNHNFLIEGVPLLWETAIFHDGSEWGVLGRYASREAAEVGHAEALAEERERAG